MKVSLMTLGGYSSPVSLRHVKKVTVRIRSTYIYQFYGDTNKIEHEDNSKRTSSATSYVWEHAGSS